MNLRQPDREVESFSKQSTRRGAVIDVKDLRFKYPGADEEALRGINLRVERGEFVGITGPTGAGKSTLTLCLRGLIPHSVGGEMGGRVTVCQTDTRRQTAAQLGEKIGLVFQDSEAQIIGLTVEEDLAFAPENYQWTREQILERIPQVLKLVRLEGLGREPTWNLSGGQKQRLVIAGALMMTPELLVLDEPTSELDPLGRDEVFELLDRLRREQGVTILMVEYAVEHLAEYADRLIEMDSGVMIREGPPRQFFRQVQLLHRGGAERIPPVAQLLLELERRGWIGPDQFTPSESQAVRLLNQLLESRDG